MSAKLLAFLLFLTNLGILTVSEAVFKFVDQGGMPWEYVKESVINGSKSETIIVYNGPWTPAVALKNYGQDTISASQLNVLISLFMAWCFVF